MSSPTPLTDTDIERLQSLLDALPEPLQPLDVTALDGYLCGVLLQPSRIEEARWLPGVMDVEGRPLPAGVDAAPLQALVRRRHAELDAAIGARAWFDPWIFAMDDEGTPSEAVLPWVAGFAAAMDRFPALMAIDSPELLEPLALMYLHFDPEDLEDADALLALIEEIEPPPDLAEAVQDLVRSVMLIADVSRPRAPLPGAGKRRPGGPRRAGPGAGKGRGPRRRAWSRSRPAPAVNAQGDLRPVGSKPDDAFTLRPMEKVSFRQQVLRVREEAIVTVVNRLLAEKGFDLMTVDEVAAEVGIAKASLYKHFPSKEALAAAAMVRVLQRGLEEVRALAARSELSPLQRLKAAARWTVATVLAGQMPSLPSQNSSLRTELLGDKNYLNALMEVSELLGAWITEAQAAGDLDAHLPPELVLYTLYARGCDPVPGFLKSTGQYDDMQIIDWVVAACFTGLQAR